MTTFLKQSTASTIILGPFVDETDGRTAESALTISQADIRLSKNSAAFAQTNNSAGATHMENGYYSIPLDATDSNTVGRLRVAVNESGALPVWRDFMVLAASVYDAIFGSTALSTLDAAGVRTAVGLASANLDTQIGDLPTNAELATSQAASDDATLAAIAALNDITVAELLDAVVEGSTTLEGALRLMLSILTGEVTGGGTTTITYRDIGDTKNRVVFTVDASGNRSAVTRDASD